MIEVLLLFLLVMLYNSAILCKPLYYSLRVKLLWRQNRKAHKNTVKMSERNQFQLGRCILLVFTAQLKVHTFKSQCWLLLFAAHAEGCLQDVTSPAVGIEQLFPWLQRSTVLPGVEMDMPVPHSAKTGAKACVSLIVCSADSWNVLSGSKFIFLLS